MQTIIWDWNGTLLNDLDFCIETINTLLKKRNLPLLDQPGYKEAFSFPVKDYYATIGFDFEKEDFAVPAREFIDIYDNGVNNCELHSAAKSTLEWFKQSGKRQFVLSAMQQNMLEQTLTEQGVMNYLEGFAGLSDHYAVSKIERGKQLIAQNNINPEKATMIGDTTHDFEVAEQLGINCILVADGHNSEQRLKATGAEVVLSLAELPSKINGEK